MAVWVKCTFSNNQPVHVNLDHVATVSRSDRESLTYITFPGDDDAILVLETPEEILKGRDK